MLLAFLCILFFGILLYVAQTFFTLVQVRHTVQFGENDNSMLFLKSLGGKGNPLAADNQGELLLGEGGLLGYR